MSEETKKPTTTVAPGSGPRPMGGNPMGMMGINAKAKNFKGTMKQLLHYIRPYWISIIFCLIFAVASTIFAIATPKILGRATNQIVNDYVAQKTYDGVISQLPKGITLPKGTTFGQLLPQLPPAAVKQIPADKLDGMKSVDLTNRPTVQFDKILSIAEELIALYILSAFFSYIQGWIMTSVSQKISYQLRRDISTKIGRMPLKYFDKNTHGEVLSRVTNDVDTVSQTLNQSLSQMVTSVTMIIGILIMMLTISYQLTLISIIILPISFVILGMLVKRSQKYFKSQQDTLGHLNGHIEEMYSGHNVMKVYNGQARSIAKFNTVNNELYDSAWKSQFFSGLMWPLMSFVGNLGFVSVSVVGGYLAIKGTINIGDIQAFIQYVNQFNQPIIQTANIANVMQSTAASAERVFEFLAESEEVAEASEPVKLEKVRGEVEFDNVVFGYDEDKTIIKGFSAKIKPGMRVAIVGPTGAGKTTMVNLLMRFYDINSGSIKVDGVDIKKFKRADLRRMFGMVLQDTWLFNGTIRENLAYAHPDATDETIIEAAKATHVDHFVHSLPGGYDMVLDEEANNISKGEKQLLTIARAMVADAPIMILDEATSSVDTRTEVLIQKAMEQLMKNRTSFVIAHRLSTIKNADLILVMKDGNIVEQGTHKELLKQKGFYASLYNSQFTAPAIEEPEITKA